MVRKCTAIGRRDVKRSKSVKMISAILLYFVVVMPIQADEYIYSMRMDDTEYTVTTTIRQDESNGTILVEKNDPVTGVIHRFVLDEQGGTVFWIVCENDKETKYTRTESSILVEETTADNEGKDVIEIDANPWLSTIPEGLQQFVADGEKRFEFWTINPETYKAYRMIAKRVTTEDIIVQGDTVRAIHIKVSASGVPALFFSMSFWYREADGVFIKYEGKAGGPGSADVITELVQKEQ